MWNYTDLTQSVKLFFAVIRAGPTTVTLLTAMPGLVVATTAPVTKLVPRGAPALGRLDLRSQD